MMKAVSITLAVLVLALVSVNLLPAKSPETTNLKIDGMTCGACETKVTKALEDLDGVESVQVDYASGSANLVYDKDQIPMGKIEAAVAGAGFTLLADSKAKKSGKAACRSGSCCSAGSAKKI